MTADIYMTDYNNMNRDELIEELNVHAYYRDEMRNTLEKLKLIFDIDTNNMPEGWREENDEHFGDFICGALQELSDNTMN